jgi:TonB family protein
MAIVDQFLRPIPQDMDSLDAARFQIGMPFNGETKLICVAVSQPQSSTQQVSAIQAFLTREAVSNETYCTNEHSSILRLQLSAGGTSRIVRNSIIRFQDCYLPQTIEEYEGSSHDQKPMLTAKLEKIEAIPSIDDAQFTPPSDAIPPPAVIALNERETKTQLLHHRYPEDDFQYPGENRSVHMAAIVVISLQVQTDGHVSNLRIERAGVPRALQQALQQASLDAVRNWTYKPFIRNGEPVEVNTTVTLVYPLTP